eukprot:COSAG01_NODE_11878_length_1842_cov_120.002869_1_plen_395_part_01
MKCEAEGKSNVNLPGDLLEKLVACDYAYTKQRIDEVPRCLLDELIVGAADDERYDGVSWLEERPVYARRDLVRIARRLAKGAREATLKSTVGGETPIAAAVATIRWMLTHLRHDLAGLGLWSDDHVWMKQQAEIEVRALRDLAANIEVLIVKRCAVEAAPKMTSANVRAPGSATRVTWATELEDVREFSAVESEEGAEGSDECASEDEDDAKFFDCEELAPVPAAVGGDEAAAVAAVCEDEEDRQRALELDTSFADCVEQPPALATVANEGIAAVATACEAEEERLARRRRALALDAEHELKMENMLAQLKLRYAAAKATAVRATVGAEGALQATAGALQATAVAPQATAGTTASAAELLEAAAGAAELQLANAGALGPMQVTADVAEQILSPAP